MSWFSRIFRKSKEALAPAVYSPAPDSGPEAAPEQTPMPAMAVESVSTRATPVLERAKNVVEADDLESENAWPVGKTIGELQTKPMSSWGNADIITGLRFGATLQLRTPLRVLLRHGEIHTDRTKPPPTIALEMWEGTWMPRRVDAALAQTRTVASDVGPVRTD